MNAPAENLGEGSGRGEMQVDHTVQNAFSSTATRTPGEHAIYLAQCGIPVFPCWPDGYGAREDGRPRYKSPRVNNWRNAATTDADQVLAWWQQWPDALIAVPTGAPSGMYVLDLDVNLSATKRTALDGTQRTQGQCIKTKIRFALTRWSGR